MCIITGDPDLELKAFAARDLIDSVILCEDQSQLATLIDQALDLYINRVINLHEFRMIIAASKKYS